MPAKKKNTSPGRRGRLSPPRTVPAFLTPMAAQLVKQLPEGHEWVYELKFDGYRALILKDHDGVEIRSRKNKDLHEDVPASRGGRYQAERYQAVVDGEVVALDVKGRPSFQALQHRGSHPAHQISFYAFDLLHLDAGALRTRPRRGRRGLPASALPSRRRGRAGPGHRGGDGRPPRAPPAATPADRRVD